MSPHKTSQTVYKGDPASENPQVISYLTLRRAVGILGITLPVILVAGSIVCGYTIIGSILLIALYFFFFEKKFPALMNYDPVFWLETIALWAFGISWLTKGRAILNDPVIPENVTSENRT